MTANKDVVAQFGKDMFEAMEKYGVDFHFEASVGGGIPIVMPLKQCLTANRVTEIMGIINGTTNYMLSQMRGGFGGCTINLVKNELYETFITTAKERYKAKFGRSPKVYDVVISDDSRLFQEVKAKVQ